MCLAYFTIHIHKFVFEIKKLAYRRKIIVTDVNIYDRSEGGRLR